MDSLPTPREESKSNTERLQDYFEIAAVKKNKAPLLIEANDTESENDITGYRITEDYRKRGLRGTILSTESRKKKKVRIMGAKCCF